MTVASPVWMWRFWSTSELRVALEQYTEYVMAQGAPPDGGDPDPERMDRTYRIYVQNRAIDSGMKHLLWENRSAWKIINFYYRQGFWAEFRGWTVPARAVGIEVPVCFGSMRCQVSGDDRLYLPLCRRGQDCDAKRRVFEERLTGALEALFAAVEVRQQRTLDAVSEQV